MVVGRWNFLLGDLFSGGKKPIQTAHPKNSTSKGPFLETFGCEVHSTTSSSLMYQIHLLEGRSTCKTSYPHTLVIPEILMFFHDGNEIQEKKKHHFGLDFGFLYGFLLRRIWSLLMTFVKGPRPGWTTRKGSERVGARCPGGCSQCAKIRVVLRECTRGRTTKHVSVYIYIYICILFVYLYTLYICNIHMHIFL